MRYDTERLRNEIARRHMTVTDFAKLAGLSKFSVYRALKGSWGTDEEIQKAFASAERGSADVI